MLKTKLQCTSKPRITAVVQIVINALCLPLYFIKCFSDTAVLPGIDENGNSTVREVIYRFSPMENLAAIDMLWLMYAAIALISASIVLSIVALILQTGKISVASYALFYTSLVVFCISFLIASTAARGY